MCASQHGHTGIVKLLLDAGANTKAMTNVTDRMRVFMSDAKMRAFSFVFRSC